MSDKGKFPYQFKDKSRPLHDLRAYIIIFKMNGRYHSPNEGQESNCISEKNYHA